MESKISRLVQSRHLNGRGVMFGGEILSWMDECAGITAQRYAGPEVMMTTVAVKEANFYKPIALGSFIDVISDIESIGNTSIRMKVALYKDPGVGEEEPTLMADAIFIFVALDKDGKPTKIRRQ